MDLKEFRIHPTKRHPWELARAKFLQSLVSQIEGQDLEALDVGSGDAWLADQLKINSTSISKITCWDKNYEQNDIKQLKSLRSANVQFVTQQPNQKFDLIFLCDILEHIEDDRSFLKNLVTHSLKPKGSVIITVPEWQKLFTAHDTGLEHFRRYSPEEIKNLIINCGLETKKTGQIFVIALLVRILEKLKESKNAKQKTIAGWGGGPLLTKLITAMLVFDAKILSFVRFIPGLTWWGVCQMKRSENQGR